MPKNYNSRQVARPTLLRMPLVLGGVYGTPKGLESQRRAHVKGGARGVQGSENTPFRNCFASSSS